MIQKYQSCTYIQKTNIMASGPITSWEMGKQWKQWLTLFFGAPKSQQMVIAAMKLKRQKKMATHASILA